MSGIAHGGNGRLWERFELANINDRIENIYQYFLNVSRQQNLNGFSGADGPQYIDRMREGIRNELDRMIKDLEIKYKELTEKGTNLNIKLRTELDLSRNEVKELQYTLKVLKQKNNNLSNKNELLKAGINKIKDDRIQRLQQQIMRLTQQLRDAERERKKQQDEHEDRVKEYKRVIKEGNNADVQGYKDEIAENIVEMNRLKRENHDQQKRLNKIEEEYKALWNKYDAEKKEFKKAIDKTFKDKTVKDKQQQKLDDLRDKLNKEFRQKLKEREEKWEKFRKQSVNNLDEKFKILDKAYKDKIATLKRDYEAKDSLLKRRDAEIDRLEKQIKKLKQEEEDIIALKKELIKYELSWKHFFGEARSLQDEIEKVNNKLDKFENHHSIQSPIPRKRRRVILQSLDQWKTMGHHGPPLTADILHYDEHDRYRRIELYNMTKNKVLELQGFHLENQAGSRIKIDSQQINPGRSITIAHDQDFCKFAEDEIIYLCDRYGERIQIFPSTEFVYDYLSIFDEDKCPLMMQQIFNEEANFRGFEFMNATKKRIKLKNMYFKNKKGTLHVPIPFEVLTRTGKIRLIVTNDPHHPKLGTNDLRVSPSALPRNLSDDILYICDQYGNDMQLYNMRGVELNGAGSSSSRSNSECYIM